MGKSWIGFAWLLVLIPLSVDNWLSIPVGLYHLRINYLGVLLAAVGFGKVAWADHTLGKQWLRHLRSRSTLCFLAMMVVGVIGSFGSVYPKRAAAFTLWTSATLIALPWVLEKFNQTLGRWVVRSVIFYASCQALIVLTDLVLCLPSDGAFHLGRVIVEKLFKEFTICRPHAFYQDPSFFSGFTLLGMLLARFSWERETSLLWRSWGGFSFLLGAVAVLICGSRMGWAGLAVFLVFEVMRPFLWRRRNAPWRPLRRTHLRFWLAFVLLVGLLGLFLRPYYKYFYQYRIQGLVEPRSEASFNIQISNAAAAYQVFRLRPVFGVGPGTAGAFLVAHHHEILGWENLNTEQANRIRHQPLSMNLYTELLSEWGIFGALFFALGLFFLWRPGGMGWALPGWSVLSVVYLLTQTLPRFDLWLVIFLIAQEYRSINGLTKAEGHDHLSGK